MRTPSSSLVAPVSRVIRAGSSFKLTQVSGSSEDPHGEGFCKQFFRPWRLEVSPFCSWLAMVTKHDTLNIKVNHVKKLKSTICSELQYFSDIFSYCIFSWPGEPQGRCHRPGSSFGRHRRATDRHLVARVEATGQEVTWRQGKMITSDFRFQIFVEFLI